MNVCWTPTWLGAGLRALAMGGADGGEEVGASWDDEKRKKKKWQKKEGKSNETNNNNKKKNPHGEGGGNVYLLHCFTCRICCIYFTTLIYIAFTIPLKTPFHIPIQLGEEEAEEGEAEEGHLLSETS